jgi:hypothetical protein
MKNFSSYSQNMKFIAVEQSKFKSHYSCVFRCRYVFFLFRNLSSLRTQGSPSIVILSASEGSHRCFAALNMTNGRKEIPAFAGMTNPNNNLSFVMPGLSRHPPSTLSVLRVWLGGSRHMAGMTVKEGH